MTQIISHGARVTVVCAIFGECGLRPVSLDIDADLQGEIDVTNALVEVGRVFDGKILTGTTALRVLEDESATLISGNRKLVVESDDIAIIGTSTDATLDGIAEEVKRRLVSKLGNDAERASVRIVDQDGNKVTV